MRNITPKSETSLSIPASQLGTQDSLEALLSADSVEIVPDHAAHPDVILTPDQATLTHHILECHYGMRRSYESQVQYALMAGIQLHALKASCQHGEFMAIREKFLPAISRSAATRYMEFATLVQTKLPTVGNINHANLLLTSGELPEAEKQSLLKAVYDAADGKSWTQFYRDLNLIRQPKEKRYHAPRNISPKDAEEAVRTQADELAKQLLADINLIQQNDTWSLLSTARQKEIENARLDLGAFIKANSPKPSRR